MKTTAVPLLMKDETSRTRQRKKKKKKKERTRKARPAIYETKPIPEPAVAPPASFPGPRKDTPVEEALRKWRMAEAKRLGVPAFRVFSDQTLRALAEKQPATTAELLAIPGIGLRTVEQYGAQIYRILHEGR